MGERYVMIVEDEPRLLHSLTFTLRRKGFRVIPVSTAESALEFLSQNGDTRCDLFITDIQLPGMSGVEFIDRLRGIPGDHRIVVMTAFPKRELEQQLSIRGIDSLLTKPFDIEELVKRVEQSLG